MSSFLIKREMTQSKSKRPGSQAVLKVHKWLSLAALAFWLVQAGTGLLLTFHREIGDRLIAGGAVPLNVPLLSQRVEALQNDAVHVRSFISTGGIRERYKVSLIDTPEDLSRDVLVDGQGRLLHSFDKEGRTWASTLVTLHESLFAGEAGRWIVGISGLLLFSNLGLGAALALRGKTKWHDRLVPGRFGKLKLRMFTWHRAIGLWAAVPAAIIVLAGVFSVFEDGIRRFLSAPVSELAAPRAGPVGGVMLEDAISTSLHLYAQARLVAVTFPTDERPVWSVRLRQPGEGYETFGRTTVYIDSTSGKVLGTLDPMRDRFTQRMIDLFYPVHTGEVFGIAGRLLVFATGSWLVVMLGTGVLLFSSRRR